MTPTRCCARSEDFFRLNYLAGAGGSKVKSFAGPLMGENGGD